VYINYKFIKEAFDFDDTDYGTNLHELGKKKSHHCLSFTEFIRLKEESYELHQKYIPNFIAIIRIYTEAKYIQVHEGYKKYLQLYQLLEVQYNEIVSKYKIIAPYFKPTKKKKIPATIMETTQDISNIIQKNTFVDPTKKIYNIMQSIQPTERNLYTWEIHEADREDIIIGENNYKARELAEEYLADHISTEDMILAGQNHIWFIDILVNENQSTFLGFILAEIPRNPNDVCDLLEKYVNCFDSKESEKKKRSGRSQ